MPGIAFKTDELPVVATILLDAALADGGIDGHEVDTIRTVLCEVGGLPRLPTPVLHALRSYDPEGFDLAGACAELGLTTRHRKRELLLLVGRVIAADGVLDAGELAWLERLAAITGRTDDQMDRFRHDLVEAMAGFEHAD